MKSGALSFSILLGFLFLGACSSEAADTKSSVQATASLINQEFITIREAQETLVQGVTALYGRYSALDLSTKGMDVAEGGIYETFPGGKYYYKNKAVGSGLYASPGKRPDEALKKQVKFLEYVDPLLQKAGASSDVQSIAFYGVREPITVALLSPWFDIVSRLPPGIDLNMFEWYQRGLKSPGPALWSAQPFTDLFSGWVMDVAMPVRVDGEVKGVGVSSVSLDKLAAKYIKLQKLSLMLMGSDTTVVGISPKAQSLLKITALENFDFLKQTKENTFVPGKFKLTDESQSVELRALGAALSQDKETVEFTLEGRTYVAFQETTKETGMKVVGFASR